MISFAQLAPFLREQMNATLTRTDVLRPMAWLLAILLVALVLLAYISAPNWILVTIVVLLVPATFLYGGAYLFCLGKDRDGLRSEKYSLHKLAIEHGLVGDSSVGLFERDEIASTGSPDSATKQIVHKP